MSDSETIVPSQASRDRSGLLIAFGVIELVIGIISFLLTGLMGLGLMMASRLPPEKVPKMNPATMVQAVLLMVVVATFFLWIGIATIKGRRWARTIMLVVSWVWLLFGCFLLMILVKQRQVGLGLSATAPGLPPSTAAVMSITTTALFSVFYLVLPLAFVLFYQRRDVKETFERKDPKLRWTDACAQPVLALCLVLGGYALCDLLLLERGVYPIFGQVLTGRTAMLVIVAHAMIYAWLAIATYKCQRVGWWGTLIFLVVVPAISFWGFSQPDPSEFLEKMGMPADASVKAMMPWVQSSASGWSLAFTAGTIGYLLYVRRFFRAAREEVKQASG